MSPRIAVTGGTGFIGRHVLPLLSADGCGLTLLQRRGHGGTSPFGRVVPGNLDDEGALGALVAGADAVVHLAGIVRGPDPAAFDAVNAKGAGRVAAAAARAGVPRFVLVSSLAARHPEASAYARSKADGEAAVRRAYKGDLSILRPPAVYGPGDRATLPVFQGMAKGLLVVPAPKGQRVSLIHVEDLARLVVRLAETAGTGDTPIEPDDGKNGGGGGYRWADLAAGAEAVLGRRVRLVFLPRSAAAALAFAFDLAARVTGRAMPFGRDKLGELYYPDWVARAAPVPGWQPRTPLTEGLRTTFEGYRQEGWIG
ncbi:MAG: NAD-dependent epimerase/dehydratase family protein [Geminicoccaceae bacterium]|nr:NAD-dependent epimerase/dehydratase family protein [Geminicoccaceae bacterium]